MPGQDRPLGAMSNGLYPVNPFDLSTDLFCMFSTQVIHLVIHLDGPIRYDHLEAAVDTASRAEPITRCRIIRQHDTLFWERAPSWCTQDHLLRLSSKSPGKLLYQALSYPLDPYQGDLFRIILIENPDRTGDILVFNVHHIVMDGRGLKDFAGLIMTCYTAYQSGSGIQVSDSSLSTRQLPGISTLIPGHRQIGEPESSTGWCSPVSVPVASLQADQYRYSLLTFHPGRTALIRTARKGWEITVNDFMIAVLARAIAAIHPEKHEIVVPLYTTIDLRRYLPHVPERSLVNFSASFEVRIPVTPGESLEETGRRVHLLMNRIKSGNPGVDEAIEAETLFQSGYTAAREVISTGWDTILKSRNKTTIFSNTGVISRELVSPGGVSVINSYLLPGFFHPPGFFFLLSTFDDIMTLSATYSIPAYDPGLVGRMLHFIDRDIPGWNHYPGVYETIM